MGNNFSFHYHQKIYINKDTNEIHIEMCNCNRNGFTKKIKLSNKDFIKKINPNPKYVPDYDYSEEWGLSQSYLITKIKN
jgi:hypothetical protein